MPKLNLPQIVETVAKEAPSRIAIIEGDRAIDYLTLSASVEKISAYLQQAALPHQCIALHLPNSVELLLLYLACLKTGIIAIPLSIMMKKTEIALVLNETTPDLFITDSRHAEEAPPLAKGQLMIVGPSQVDRPQLAFQAMLEHDFPFLPVQADSEAPAAIFFTSGSTGKPKGVMHSQQSLSAIAEVMGDCFAVTAQDRFLVSEAMTNASGCSHAMLTLQVGATAVMIQDMQIANLKTYLHRYQPTLLCIMGKGNYDIVNSSQLTAEDFPSVRLNLTGGDKVPPELMLAFQQKTRAPLRLSYGMSEILVITINKSDDPDKRESIGTAAKHVAIQLRDAENKPVPDGVAGEAWVKGPNMLLGYWQDAEETRKALVDGWLRTGDLLRRDTEGYYWFYGRIKNLIIRQGDNISPLEVEKALMRHPAVLDAGVIGVPHPEEGHVPVAFVELKPQHAATSAELQDFIVTQLEDYKIPETILVLAALPRTKSGKVDRVTLKQLYENS